MLSFTLSDRDVMPPPPKRAKIKLLDQPPSPTNTKVTKTVTTLPKLKQTKLVVSAPPRDHSSSGAHTKRDASKKHKPLHRAVIMQAATDRNGVRVFHLNCTCLSTRRMTSTENLPDSRKLRVNEIMGLANADCAEPHAFRIPFRLHASQPES